MAIEQQSYFTIRPRSGWQALNLGEIFRYRDLFYFFVWRDIKVRYAQSVLGVGWALIQPLFNMVVFTIIFGKLAKLSSDGSPYYLFSLVALVPWHYFSGALSDASGSLVGGSNLVNKVYFPRMILPLAAALSKMVDFIIALTITVALLLFSGRLPSGTVLLLPLLCLLMFFSASGVGMWLTSLAVQYRDIRYGLGFGLQLLMYGSPVVYSVSVIPDKWIYLYACNPMVGVIESFRSIFLGTRAFPWDLLAVGSFSTFILLISGAFYFRRMEKFFADVA
jgi:lipopolysaccharide transport system permease protein